MIKAPERIATWCWNGKTNAGQWSNNLPDHYAPTVEYIRADLVDALDAENQRLRGALEQIAIQKRTDELATAYAVEFADFEDGYDLCIDCARAALTGELTPPIYGLKRTFGSS